MSREYTQQINFDDGIRFVKINERGDVASININDSTFAERFVNFINWLEAAAADFGKSIQKPEENAEVDIDGVIKQLKGQTELCCKACEILDGLFGAGVCRNAFGVDVPDAYCILNFLEQLTPFVNWAISERGDQISVKYNRNRKGGRTQRSKAELISDYKAGNGK